MNWYRRHGRDLPWRHTRDAYAILVSEFMLQQTQVATVLPYYNEWFCRFPDFSALARASEGDVLHAWQGLGYYARARNLHATAKTIVDQYGCRFPKSIEQMRQLPGIGKYTAHAVAAFAFDQSVPIVEANVARVLARIFNLQIPIDKTAGREVLWNRATQLVPKRGAARFNSALVDLGALVCLPRKPRCRVCPVRKFCRATNPEILPMRKTRPRTKQLTENHAFVVRQNKILLERSRGRWRRMWILPPLKTRALKRQPIYRSIFPFTHHRVALKVYQRRPCEIDMSSQRWIRIRSLDRMPIPSPHRRAIIDLLSARVPQIKAAVGNVGPTRYSSDDHSEFRVERAPRRRLAKAIAR